MATFLEKALIKLRETNLNILDEEIVNSLPRERNDTLWESISKEYSLTSLETSALKNHRCQQGKIIFSIVISYFNFYF